MSNRKQKDVIDTKTVNDNSTMLTTLEQPMTVSKVTVEYTQKPDSNSYREQVLKVSREYTDDNVYYVIETERWAFDNLNDLIRVINDFEVITRK